MLVRKEIEHYLGVSFEDEFVSVLRGDRTHSRWLTASNRRTFRPPFDIYETDEHIVIKVEIAGMREEEIAVSVDGQNLRISGRRGDSGGKLAYQRMEINYGDFELDIRLPSLHDESRIEASYERGFLILQIPKTALCRHVPITTQNT